MSQSDTEGGATRRGDPSTAARPAGKAGNRDRDKQPVLVIEGRGPARAGDDDPTRIMMREDSRPVPPVRSKKPTGKVQLEAQAKEDAAAKAATSEDREEADDRRNWRLLVLVIALLGALALAWVFYGP